MHGSEPGGEEQPGGFSMQSIRRALATLDVLVARAPQAVAVSDLARHLGVSVATASRILATLAEQGYAARTVDRRYLIGVRSLPLATNWMRRIRAAAIGPATRVADETGGIAVVSQMLGSQQVPVLVKQTRPLQGAGAEDLAQVTKPHPLWATASGRALLGGLPPAQRARLLPETVPQMTPLTLPSPTDIQTTIRTGLKDGMHVDQGEVCSGLWCCAVALGSNHAKARLAIAAISLYEPDPAQVTRVRRALRREAGLEVSR